MESSRRWATRANGLTLLRLLMAPLLVWAIMAERSGLAMLLFWLAVATDVADGWAARRYGEATPLGAVIDHAVDATFVTAVSAALAWQCVLPGALPPLIALAFLQYALDSRYLVAQGLRGSPLGRWNGIAYYVIVAIPIIRDTLGWGWPGAGLLRLLGWALVASTLLSMGDRLRLLASARRARG